jgi:hypothetical protein
MAVLSNINILAVSVIWQYTGLSPKQIERHRLEKRFQTRLLARLSLAPHSAESI